jgi:hypothetical protein
VAISDIRLFHGLALAAAERKLQVLEDGVLKDFDAGGEGGADN